MAVEFIYLTKRVCQYRIIKRKIIFDFSLNFIVNSVFETINSYKKSQIQDWPKMKKLYMHKDSHSIIRKMVDEPALAYIKYAKEQIKDMEKEK